MVQRRYFINYKAVLLICELLVGPIRLRVGKCPVNWKYSWYHKIFSDSLLVYFRNSATIAVVAKIHILENQCLKGKFPCTKCLMCTIPVPSPLPAWRNKVIFQTHGSNHRTPLTKNIQRIPNCPQDNVVTCQGLEAHPRCVHLLHIPPSPLIFSTLCSLSVLQRSW